MACYDQALHAITDGSYGDEKIAAWDERLSRIFNRGFWDGYYMGQRLWANGPINTDHLPHASSDMRPNAQDIFPPV